MRSDRRFMVGLLTATILPSVPASAQDEPLASGEYRWSPDGGLQRVPITVQFLVGEGYEVVSSFTTNLGPALFLQRAEKLFMCFVTETPDNPVITTNYCKPVR